MKIPLYILCVTHKFVSLHIDVYCDNEKIATDNADDADNGCHGDT